MASLTTEQLRIIEEKKKAALLKRQQLSQSKNTPHNPILTTSAPSAPLQQKPYVNHTTNNSLPSTSNGNSFFTKTVTATCTLISDDRFVVNMNYHAPSIEVFKTIAGRMYDPKSKLWTFPLTSYEELISKLKAVKEVLVGGIPNNVIKALRTPSKNLDEIDLSKIDKTLLESLMPFQETGVRFGISRNGRCLIADDMGLGKTIQALGIAHYYYENWPLLIVCPSSMRFPWEEAIQTFLPSVSPFYITVMTTTKDLINDAKVVICSYDLMKSALQDLLRKKFGVIILDESHSLKCFKTARTKASLEIAKKCSNVILLSGTPALSRPSELYPQIEAIDPHAFKSFHDFGIRYCDGKKEKYGWNFNGSSNMEELEIYLKKRIMIRRMKSEVISQLPSKLRKVIVLHPNMVKAVSNQMKSFASQMDQQKGMEKRSTLLQWFTITGQTKLNAVCEYLQDKLESDHKFLVFAHHLEVLNGISDMLIKKNIQFIRIDGSTNPETRKVYCDRFQTQDSCRVAVLSIKAANSGITLTAAQLVIFAELFWNPGELTQAEDRVHRIGQNDSVVVEYLVAKGTADERLWSLIQSKLNVLNKAGLSKDNFKDANTEHLPDQSTTPSASKNLTIPEMFNNNSSHKSVENGKDSKNENSSFEDFQDFGDFDDDAFADIVEQIETEYEVEKKKRKTDSDV